MSTIEIHVFVPLTPVRLSEAVRTGQVRSEGPVFRAEHPALAGPDEVEAAEFDALCSAAAGSLALLVDADEPPRRAVAVVRTTPDQLRTDGEDSILPEPVAWVDVDAVYLDEPEAGPDLTAVLDAVRRETEPTDAQYDVVEERALLWFAPSELSGA